MVIETFDATLYGSPVLAVETLKTFGIQLTQRLGARIFALGRSGVQFSLAFLEEAQAAGPAQIILLSPEWMQEGLDLDRATRLVGTDYKVLQDPTSRELAIRVITSDEAWALPPVASEAPRGGMLAPLAAAPAPLGLLLGSNLALPRGSAWDRQHLEQAAQRLLDGEESAQLLEDFRYLFRAALAQKLDPSPLLEAALQRGKPELNKEVAAAIKNQLDREVGLIFEGLFSDETNRVILSLEHLSRREPLAEARILAVIAEVLWPQREVRTALLEHSGKWGPSLERDRKSQERLIELFLANLGELLPDQRGRLTETLLEWQKTCPDLRHRLYERARLAELTPGALVDLRLFLINVLSLCPDFPLHSELLEWCKDLALHHFQRSGVLERLALCLTQLGGSALLEFLQMRDGLLPEDSEAWLVDLVVRWLSRGEPHLPATPGETSLEMRQALAEFVLAGLVRGARNLVLAASRRGVLGCGELHLLVNTLSLRQRRVSQDFLSDLAARVEPPDDEPIFDFLPHLGREALDSHLRRVREEASRESAASAFTLLRIARLLVKHVEIGDLSAEQAAVWVEDCLVLPIFSRNSLSAVWLGLGYLGSVPGLPDQLVQGILRRILEEGDKQPVVQSQALRLLHSGGPASVRLAVEKLLLEDLAVEPGVPLRTLSSKRRTPPVALEAWLAMAREVKPLENCELLATTLSRVLLKVRSDSVGQALQHALRESREGDLGVRTRSAWDKDDCDLALQVLSAIAQHPATPESLHNMLVSRLYSSLLDWIDRVEKGRDLYNNRTTPLWDEFCALLQHRPSPRVVELSHEAVKHLISLHENFGGRLQLRNREDAQRLLVALIRKGAAEEGVELRLQLLHLILDLAQPNEEISERPVALYFVRLLHDYLGELPISLQEELAVGVLRLKPWLDGDLLY